MTERAHIELAAQLLGDRLANIRDSRLAEIERALCRPLPPEERKAMVREYHEIYERRSA